MTRHRRGQNRKQRLNNKNSTINSFNDSNIVDKKYFPDDHFVNNENGDFQRFSDILPKQLNQFHNEFISQSSFSLKTGIKRHRRQMNSNFSAPSSSSTNQIKVDNLISFNSNKSEFHPIQQNTSKIIKPRSSIAELVMKGEIDHSLGRVTTARPTIVIYPTGRTGFNYLAYHVTNVENYPTISLL